MTLLAQPSQGGSSRRVTSCLSFLPQGPTWGSKDKCFTKMYTTSGECCKACNLGEGVVQPCGVNQTVCEPCLDSEYPPRSTWGAARGCEGGLVDHEHYQVLECILFPSWARCLGALCAVCLNPRRSPRKGQLHPPHPISAPTPGSCPALACEPQLRVQHLPLF